MAGEMKLSRPLMTQKILSEAHMSTTELLMLINFGFALILFICDCALVLPFWNMEGFDFVV